MFLLLLFYTVFVSYCCCSMLLQLLPQAAVVFMPLLSPTINGSGRGIITCARVDWKTECRRMEE